MSTAGQIASHSSTDPAGEPRSRRMAFDATPRFSRQLLLHCLSPIPGLRDGNGPLAGVERFAERAPLLAREGDVVCLPHVVPPDYLEYLRSLGLGPAPSHVIALPAIGPERQSNPLLVRLLQQTHCLRRVADLMSEGPDSWLHCYVSSETDALLQCRLASLIHKPVHLVNSYPGRIIKLHDKQYVRQKAAELGLPLPPGDVVRLMPGSVTHKAGQISLRRAVAKHAAVTGCAIVRGVHGAFGSSVFLVRPGDRSQWQRLEEACRHGVNSVFLVEPFYEVLVSPHISMFIDPRDQKISCLSISDQILDQRLRHQGHCYPSHATRTEEMLAAAQKFCVWLRDRRITGYQSFDFCEYEQPGSGERQFFFAELNARVSASAYPTNLLQQLNVRFGKAPEREPWQAFRSMVVRTRAKSFAELRAAFEELLFDPRKAAGIIPFNVGMLRHGRFALVIVGRTTEEVQAVYEQYCQRAAATPVPASNRQGTDQAA